jgi:hypothetical protein
LMYPIVLNVLLLMKCYKHLYVKKKKHISCFSNLILLQKLTSALDIHDINLFFNFTLNQKLRYF